MKEQIIQIPDTLEIKEIKDGKIILVEKEKKLTYEDVANERSKNNMTQKEKELLFKDLCNRLPYGVMVKGVFINYNTVKDKIIKEECNNRLTPQMLSKYESIKPYLRPMSSMTDEEDVEYTAIGRNWPADIMRRIDWLNAHHFDYRGLIEKGLALEAPKDMYK